MTIKDIEVKPNDLAFSIKAMNNIVNLYHMLYDKDSGDSDTYSLAFNRINYKEGIEDLIETNSCLIKGDTGSLEIYKNDNKTYDVTIKTPYKTAMLKKVDYTFYE